MILFPKARRPVIGSAIGKTGPPKVIHRHAARRLEAPMTAMACLGPRPWPHRYITALRMIAIAALAIAEPSLVAADLGYADRRHDGVIECFGGGEIGDGNGYMIEHAAIMAATA